MTVLPTRDPLLDGAKKPQSINFPENLLKALQRQSVIDGYPKLTPYVVDLLVFALRTREAEQQVIAKK